MASLLAACSVPPRETDRSTPEGCFRTFRGAIARAEYEREYDCLSDHLKTQLGIASRLDWKDARTVVLTQSHMAVKGLSRARITGPAKPLQDGRVQLPVAVNAVLFSVSGTLTLRQAVVMRAWAPGEEEPVLEWPLPHLRLGKSRQGLGVLVPLDDQEMLYPELPDAMELSRFEAARLWYLDGFELGDDNTATIQEEVDKQRGS
ncbi:MAG: hypothetical protein ACYTHK_16805 [Planctomycetota bacterium]|jgi:hypothetical protein